MFRPCAPKRHLRAPLGTTADPPRRQLRPTSHRSSHRPARRIRTHSQQCRRQACLAAGAPPVRCLGRHSRARAAQKPLEFQAFEQCRTESRTRPTAQLFRRVGELQVAREGAVVEEERAAVVTAAVVTAVVVTVVVVTAAVVTAAAMVAVAMVAAAMVAAAMVAAAM
eukprot:5072644-Pleurochrysis_carterae.AAC.1